MATSQIPNVRMMGIASAVPEETAGIADDARKFGAEDARKISESTGIRNRHIAPPGLCTSDLCHSAATKLLDDLGWERDSVDALIFVTQTPDYILPATSCALQSRLGLSPQCAAFDITLGCSGYTYGLWIASQLIASGQLRRALLLVGETASRPVSPLDRAVAPLFGDAGTATAIEYDPHAPPTTYCLGTDGNGRDHIIIPAGSFRTPANDETARRHVRDDGNHRSDEDLFMNGPEVFAFSIREVPKLIKKTMASAGWTEESVDAFVMHQANKFMLQHIAKRLKIPAEKLVLSLEDFGNTSSASIPLTITHRLASQVRSESQQLLLAGFGVGWSWGAAAIHCGPMVVPELIIVPSDSTQHRKAA